MRPYSRPYLKSSRVRHFAAGIGAALLLVGLTAASTVGIAPANDVKGIMDLTIDVQDLPCDEPFDENERVLVEPDTMSSGQIRMHVVVRNRDCCCCEGQANFGSLRNTGVRGARETVPTPPPVAAVPEAPVADEVSLTTIEGAGLAPLAANPGLRPAQGRPYEVVTERDRAGVPWWLALAAAPAILLFGRDSGDVCEDDETGRNSGPARTC